ncbi:MAG TPA: caspase family protein [Pyrinomonadaceae bacterium]|nr:caspase family protein [Pyrinomonadaceae bacterium]
MTEVAETQNKRALLIGVNKYPNLPAHSQLRGCVNDVQIMKQTLETSFGFDPNNIHTLVDEQATARGILDAMEKLVAVCQPNDVVVLHFSGHGSRMAAIGEKASGYDESIMPSDSGRMNPAFPVQVPPCDIRDTEVQDWLSRLTQKTSRVTVIFDSCHSGSITRMHGESEEYGTRLRWIEPPDPLQEGSGFKLTSVSHSRNVEGGSGWLELSDKYVLLAACAAEQGAYEMDHDEFGTPTRNGAFTFFLTQELNRATENTYQDIWDIVATKVNNRFQKQTPQLEGARDRQIFDVSDFVPMRYLLVTNRQDDEVQLAGGAIHGVTVDSQWEIYPPGTKKITEAGNKSQGVVRIVTIEPVTARGKIIEEGSLPIAQSARAVEVIRPDVETRMAIWLETAARGYEKFVSELRETLAQSNLLEVTESASTARALITIVCPEGANHTGVAPTWEVLDQSQARLMSQCLLSSPESKLRILENLETLWRYEKVLELRNEKSALKGKIDFVLLKTEPTNQWQEVAEGEPIYKEGDRIAFRVTNRSGIPLHVSVLDLGLSKRITLLYPPASASETIASRRSGGAETEVEAGGTLYVGNRPESEIELFFPASLPLSRPGADGKSVRGKEVFKLCVTTQRHDLAFLKQLGLRAELGQELLHPLERLVYLATTSGSAREARVKLALKDEWFTIERSFWLEQIQ